MSTLEIKEQLHEYIDHLDDRLTNIIYGIIKADMAQETIVGFDVEGNPLNEKAYIKDIDEARAQIIKGESVSQETLEKQSENW